MKRTFKMTTLIFSLASLLVLGMALIGVDRVPSARAQSNAKSLCPGNCSTETVKGCYAIELYGWQGTGPNRRPFALVGFYSADGKGNLSGVGTISDDGVIIPDVPVTATYTVDPNTCTGKAVSNVGTFDFAIDDSGKESRAISNTPGFTVHGVARRQFGS